MNPSLYQLNPRTHICASEGRSSTLDNIPDTLLEHLATIGIDWLWLLGVWTIAPSSREIARNHRDLRREFQQVLPDLSNSDICGSPFAVVDYAVDQTLGGDAALARFRRRLKAFGIKLMVDFVPNHVGLDHPWVATHPDYFLHGEERDLIAQPDLWIRLESGEILAHGRDPNFPGWSDTLQLNYFNPDLHHAMLMELRSIADRADGVRCDMAMLLEPEIFSRTWEGRSSEPSAIPRAFWPGAISAIKKTHSEFKFVAEVYWGYEHTLQQHGFDHTYDKTLYDRILGRRGAEVRSHLTAPLTYQKRLARFLENHDEARISSKLNLAEHRAAAALAFFSPGMRFLHDGQLTGKKVRIPVQLSRAPRESIDHGVEEIYRDLLPIINSPSCKHGAWSLLEVREAWPYNSTHHNFIVYLIEHPLKTLLVTVNFAPHRGQCFVRIPDRAWYSETAEFRDLLSHQRLVRSTLDLRDRGLFLDCAEWQTQIFSLEHE